MTTHAENATQELIDLLRARSTALVQKDAAFFRRVLADDFTYTNASGAVLDKAAYLESYIESQAIQWQAQELDDVDLRLYGGVAVVTCRIHDRATFQGEAFDRHFRSTQVFVQQPDGWRYVAGHTSPAEQA
jgi:ketosteroid isomerase-like protein